MKFLVMHLQDYDYNLVRKMNNHIMSKLKLNEIGNIKIAYTAFKNSITFIPKIEEIYPISEIEGEEISRKEILSIAHLYKCKGEPNSFKLII